MSTVTLQPFLAGRTSSSAATLRLTRRGRFLVLALALIAAFVVGAFVSTAGSVAGEHAGTAEPTRIVQVHTGDTLWQIASDVAADGDVRAAMTTIERLNAMSGSAIHVGQRLVVPAG